jgi:signal transduction histidine kinase
MSLLTIAESAAQISADSLPTVWGDATQLTQVFQNLIANAIEFRRDLPPQIQISVRAVGEMPAASTDGSGAVEIFAPPPSAWCFAVADNGIGIEPQDLDRIFVIFQRLHPRVTYRGTGIGLAICKKIVERHGGTIWVESVPTRSNLELQPLLPMSSQCYGSVFYFTIPAVGSISPQHAHKQPRH